jgi:hypothetical protein
LPAGAAYAPSAPIQGVSELLIVASRFFERREDPPRQGAQIQPGSLAERPDTLRQPPRPLHARSAPPGELHTAVLPLLVADLVHEALELGLDEPGMGVPFVIGGQGLVGLARRRARRN